MTPSFPLPDILTRSLKIHTSSFRAVSYLTYLRPPLPSPASPPSLLLPPTSLPLPPTSSHPSLTCSSSPCHHVHLALAGENFVGAGKHTAPGGFPLGSAREASTQGPTSQHKWPAQADVYSKSKENICATIENLGHITTPKRQRLCWWRFGTDRTAGMPS